MMKNEKKQKRAKMEELEKLLGKSLNMEQSLLKADDIFKKLQITDEDIIQQCYLEIIAKFKEEGMEYINDEIINDIIAGLLDEKDNYVNNFDFYGVKIPISCRILHDEKLSRDMKEKIIVENLVRTYFGVTYFDHHGWKKNRNITMLLQHFGLLENKGYTFKEIGNDYGVSQTTVQLIIEKILDQFRCKFYIDCYSLLNSDEFY